ncbi:DUF5809 family protein [Natronobacterium gregoryi]|uniref:Uncharacterized protein n=2 Tax=Natronobacterium gregoryi TaxID=44930 RepID=L0AGS4_NATGS|nr:DUF5809 family protein [Natronobacterium gregoryi]AFZ73088.1 hypothetical protein Natgr_1904 [Natronobacterium gregoryi SP2]ELY70813.1 hypothetical protein C490_05967 [Natronobacterium gregoryi SP2]PLK20392.1 hypothetical protein CYV19_09700 [Natronobacterium gregoryi SP2]SFI61425.1 hypothetical protein SAMN05443661_102177 [Natronobacterium gregoryi]
MHTVGTFAPSSVEEAREQFESVGPAAQTVVREVTKVMEFDPDEYDDRVTGEVVETARDALFASLLEVQVGTREEYESWRDAYDGGVTKVGHERVDHVVWHAGPEGEAVAATFQDEEAAAVATLRRQAFGRLYREQL